MTLAPAVLLQDDPELPFTEDDYRRRKCHSNFKDHINAEKLVIKMGKSVSNLIQYVEKIHLSSESDAESKVLQYRGEIFHGDT